MTGQFFKVALLSASPKSNQDHALSAYLSSRAAELIGSNAITISPINVRNSLIEGQTESAFKTMLAADAMVIIFPLYFFCLPGMLTRFLQDYHQYWLTHQHLVKQAKIYTVINCGFPEPDLNAEASRVIASFSQHISAEFRFAVFIGGGGMLLGFKDMPWMKKTTATITAAFTAMKDDL